MIGNETPKLQAEKGQAAGHWRAAQFPFPSVAVLFSVQKTSSWSSL